MYIRMGPFIYTSSHEFPDYIPLVVYLIQTYPPGGRTSRDELAGEVGGHLVWFPGEEQEAGTPGEPEGVNEGTFSDTVQHVALKISRVFVIIFYCYLCQNM